MSDVHLGAVPSAMADEFASSFVSFVRAATTRPNLRLVLLGDVFDLLEAVEVPARRRERVPDQEDVAIRALDEIHARHPDVFEALGDFVRVGRTLDVVAGNHDVELALPAVQRRFVDLLRVAGDDVAFHPWFLHVAGVVHAEHGHLHHDLNRVDEPLGPRGAALRLPPGSYLPPRAAGRIAMLAAAPRFLRAVMRVVDPRRPARRRAYVRDVVARSAPALGLGEDTLASLLAVSDPSLHGIALRVARKAVGRRRRSRPTQRGDYLHRATQQVHDVLERTGDGTPYYVVGHTHIAEVLPLEGATYVNCGTWSPFLSGQLEDRRPSYVSIVADDGGPPTASIQRWSGA